MKKITPLILPTYLSVIEQSVGSSAYRHFYAKEGGKKIDIMRDGDLSCAFFASSVLAMFGLIGRMHGTVDGTVRDLEASGWKKIKKPKAGAVLVWAGRLDERNEMHKHIGFYVGKNKAVSNSSKKRSPALHGWKFADTSAGNPRPIEAIYWLPRLR